MWTVLEGGATDSVSSEVWICSLRIKRRRLGLKDLIPRILFSGRSVVLDSGGRVLFG